MFYLLCCCALFWNIFLYLLICAMLCCFSSFWMSASTTESRAYCQFSSKSWTGMLQRSWKKVEIFRVYLSQIDLPEMSYHFFHVCFKFMTTLLALFPRWIFRGMHCYIDVVFAGLDLEIIGSRAEEIFGGRYKFSCCCIHLKPNYFVMLFCYNYVLIEINFKQFGQRTDFWPPVKRLGI